MPIAYIKGSCTPLPEANVCESEDIPEPTEGEAMDVVDASAYVSGVVPVPEKPGFVISRLHENVETVAADFKNPDVMKETLARIATFVEVDNKKRIPTLQEVIPAEGHDLKLSDIAIFYNRCAADGVTLTAKEEELLGTMRTHGLLRKNDLCQYEATVPRVLIGMSRSSENRREIFVHEYSHALYFLDSDFHAEVSKTWHTLRSDVRRFLTGALTAGGYDAGTEELIETEVQAYAIAEPLSLDGFAIPLRTASNNCAEKPSLKACQDFWSYRGRLVHLLEDLHARYMDVARCRVPLLDNCNAPPPSKSGPEVASSKTPQQAIHNIVATLNLEKLLPIDFKSIDIDPFIRSHSPSPLWGLQTERFIGAIPNGAGVKELIDILQEEMDKAHGKGK